MKSLQKQSPDRQDGFILIIVLGFLAIGGLLIASLINLTDTGTMSGKRFDEKVRLEYAADAGIEEALYRMKTEDLPFSPGGYGDSYSYNLTDTINGKDVSVNITYIWPLTGLETDAWGTEAPETVKITGGIISKTNGVYKIQISYDGTQGDLPVHKISVWLPSRFEYVSGNTTGMVEHANAVSVDPTITFERGGKVLTWTFDPAVNFLNLPNPTESGVGFTPGNEFPSSRKMYFQVEPKDDIAGGSFCWVEVEDESTDHFFAWETGCDLYQITSTATDNATGRSYALNSSTYFSEGSSLGEGVYQMKGDYRAIGNTLMTDKDPDDNIRYTWLESSSANVTDIPSDGEVVLAYLYWAGWLDNSSQADQDINFSVNGQGVYFDEYGEAATGTGNLSATRYSTIPTGSGDYHYACFADVTDLIVATNPQGNGEYTVANVTADTGNLLSYSGWSLVIFYSSPSEQSHQMFIYDQFLYADPPTHGVNTFTIEGFETPENAEATVTCFVGEGDEEWGHNGTSPVMTAYWDWSQGWPPTYVPADNLDWLKFNGYYMTDNDTNPTYNVWNGKSSGLAGLFIDGVDIDTFDVSEPVIDPGDWYATVEIGTNADKFCLIYIVLSFSSEYGGLTPNASGIISYSGGY